MGGMMIPDDGATKSDEGAAVAEAQSELLTLSLEKHHRAPVG
jgi:hypothetical protein